MLDDPVEPVEIEPVEKEEALPAEPLRRRDRRKAETRERIFEAALSLLCERDFDAVTIEMITEAADVGKGTFFNYFPNKEAVIAYYFEMIRVQLLHSLQIPAEDATAISDGEQGPIWMQFLATAQRMAAIDGRNHRLARTLLALCMTNDAVRLANEIIKQDVGNSAKALVRRGQETGEFRRDVPAEVLAEFVGNTYFSVLYSWAQYDKEETLETAMLRNFTMAGEALKP